MIRRLITVERAFAVLVVVVYFGLGVWAVLDLSR